MIVKSVAFKILSHVCELLYQITTRYIERHDKLIRRLIVSGYLFSVVAFSLIITYNAARNYMW